MGIAQIISMCLACFSLGMSISCIIWTLPIKEKSRKSDKEKSIQTEVTQCKK